MNYIKQNHLSLLIILWLVVTGLFGGGLKVGVAPANLTTIGNPWTFTNTASPGGVTLASTTVTAFKVGQVGTKITKIKTGICYLAPSGTTVAASSTVSVDCQGTLNWGASGVSALAGVTVDDTVIAELSTTTAGSTFLGLKIIGSSASTTAGYITLKIANWTGNTYTWGVVAGTASGTVNYIVTDN